MSIVNALSCAKYMIEKSDRSLSNLSLQKALYLAQMLWIGLKEEPLFGDSIEAWDYGPVVPAVYHKLKPYGAKPVKSLISANEITDQEVIDHLDEIVEFVCSNEPFELVRLTHLKGGAWDKNYRADRKGVVIPMADIQDEYRSFYND